MLAVEHLMAGETTLLSQFEIFLLAFGGLAPYREITYSAPSPSPTSSSYLKWKKDIKEPKAKSGKLRGNEWLVFPRLEKGMTGHTVRHLWWSYYLWLNSKSGKIMLYKIAQEKSWECFVVI